MATCQVPTPSETRGARSGRESTVTPSRLLKVLRPRSRVVREVAGVGYHLSVWKLLEDYFIRLLVQHLTGRVQVLYSRPDLILILCTFGRKKYVIAKGVHLKSKNTKNNRSSRDDTSSWCYIFSKPRSYVVMFLVFFEVFVNALFNNTKFRAAESGVCAF